MERNLVALARTNYDLLVVGAGIYGACIARDAAQRGLRVALIDRGDFGNATSHNSLKLIHGGVRYLQHFDFRRLRQSVQERRFWLSMAPHLVRPLRFVMPTYGHGSKGIEALWAGLKLYNLLSLDRNENLPETQCLPASYVISKQACQHLIPGVDDRSLSGAAVWYDGQMLDTDRVLYECVLDAVDVGAEAANYLAAKHYVIHKNRVKGVRVRSVLDHDEFDIRARLTVNACGPWTNDLRRGSAENLESNALGLSKCMNLVTRPFFAADYAFGVKSNRAADAIIGESKRIYFITPWQGRAIIGTSHLPYRGEPDECYFSEADISAFIEEINVAYPPAKLTLGDVDYCYGGLTPADTEQSQDDQVARARRSVIIDHFKTDGIANLISVVGVKYTTARLVAEKAVDLIFLKLGKQAPACTTSTRPLPGARGFSNISSLEQAALAELPSNITLDRQALRNLLHSYGANYRAVLAVGEPSDMKHDDAIFRCRCRWGQRMEMALRLQDLLLRRTDLAVRGLLTTAQINWSANMMGAELNWSEARKRTEIEGIQNRLRYLSERPARKAS